MLTHFGRADGFSSKRIMQLRLVLIAGAGFASMCLIAAFTLLSVPRDASSSATLDQPPYGAVGLVALPATEIPIPASSALSEAKLKTVLWPRNQVPPNAIQDVAQVRGLYALVDIPPNSPILRNQLTAQPSQIRLRLGDKMRAVAIDVSPTEDVEGHTMPGTRVDVVFSRLVNGEMTSRIIVQDARVLSCGGDMREVAERPGVVQTARTSCRTLTLEVTPPDALAVITAKKLGSLSLIMRPAGDVTAVGPLEFPAHNLNGTETQSPKPFSNACIKGHAVTGNEKWAILCDGTLSRVLSEREP